MAVQKPAKYPTITISNAIIIIFAKVVKINDG
jgi:hypothetical protein